MDTKGCKFMKFRLGKCYGWGVPFTNSIYITFRLREGDQQSMNEKRITS